MMVVSGRGGEGQGQVTQDLWVLWHTTIQPRFSPETGSSAVESRSPQLRGTGQHVSATERVRGTQLPY